MGTHGSHLMGSRCAARLSTVHPSFSNPESCLKFEVISKAPPRQRQRGLSLIEICVVMALIVVLVSGAAIGMRSLIDMRKLDGAATQLASDIQFIRTESIARNQALRLSFHTHATGSCYVIHSGAAGDCKCDVDGPAQCSGSAMAIKTVRVANADRVTLETNVDSVVFDPLHGTSSPTGTLRMIGTQGRAVHHVINVMGRTRSCSPLSLVPGYRAC